MSSEFQYRCLCDRKILALDLLSDRALNELQKLIKTAQRNAFWDRIAVAKSIESQKTIQKLTEQQQKMDKRQNELRKCLATAYEDKVKGGMDDKTSVRLNNQFKRERDQVKEAQQKIQEKFETAQKFWDGLARFERKVEGQVDGKIIAQDIVG